MSRYLLNVLASRDLSEIADYFESYIIFYRILDDGVEILRVLSGRRNFPDFFQD